MATSYIKNPSITRNFATIKQIILEHRKELREI